MAARVAAFGPVELLFLLAPLVVVPLALGLLARDQNGTMTAIRRAWAPAAVLAVATFLLPRGPSAAAVAAGWLAFTLAVAAHGAFRLWRARAAPEVSAACACLLLPVGGAWLVLSRSGVSVLGFEEPIPLLTAVHFHFAALGALTIIGEAARADGGRAYPAIVGAAVVGLPLVAAGLTFLPALELVGAAALTGAIGAVAIRTLVRVVPRAGVLAGSLLALSSLSGLAAMALAITYAFGQATGIGFLSLGQMVRTHGPINGLGFVLCGLLGWTLFNRAA